MKRIVLSILCILIFSEGVDSFAQTSSLDEALAGLTSCHLGENPAALQIIEEAVVRSVGDIELRARLRQAFRQVLQADSPFGAKRFACRQLALIGGDDEVAALAGLLPDPPLSSLARYALARIPGENVDQALIAALVKTSGPEKRGIINTLGHRRSQAAAESLTGLVLGEDRDLAAEAALALGRIGTAQAQNILQKSLLQSKVLDRQAWGQAYLICADQLASQGDAQAALQGYVELFRSDLPGHIRAGAFRGIVQQDSRRMVPLLTSGLSDSHPEISQMAATLARQISGGDLTVALAKILPECAPSVQVQLIHALADRGDKQALSAITDITRSKVPAVRAAALEALGTLGDASSIEPLAGAAVGAEETEREIALQSLRRLRGADVDPALIARLETADPARQEVLIQVLEQRNAVQAASVLLRTSASQDRAVGAASVKALRSLAGQNEIAPLIDLLMAADGEAARPIRQTLVSVARRCGAEQQAARLLRERSAASPSAAGRSEAIQALGDLAVEEALPALRAWLGDADREVRFAAVQALCRWPDAEPMPDLLKVARSDEQPRHRILALRGYVDLLDRGPDLSDQEKLSCLRQALALAENDGEKKYILAALANRKTAEALQYARGFLDDANLKQEAAQACVSIASAIYQRDRAASRAGLEMVLAAGVMESFQQQARKVIEQIDALRDYLADWEVAGPYLQPGKNYAQLFDVPFAPEQPGAPADWRPMPVSQLDDHPAYLDLLAALDGGEQRVAYLRTTVESEEQRTARLEMFTDDGVKAWIDGQLVHANNTARPIPAQPDIVEVTLKKGANRILLKVTQNNMPWGAIVRLRPVKRAEPRVGPGFRLHVINAESKFEAAGVLDVNRDGRLDIFCGGFWYEAPGWRRHFVRELTEEHEYYNDFANLPMDVDGDGWMDVVSVGYFNRAACWIRNPGKPDDAFVVTEIDTPGSMETAITVDIDGDGRMDLLPNIGGSVAWYAYRSEPSAAFGVKWIRHDLPKEATGHGIGAGDVDGDGRCDVVGPNGYLEQPADAGGAWIWHADFQLGAASIPILVHDVDGDGDADIVWGMGHDYGIYWLEQTQIPDGGRRWQRHTIDKDWSQPHFMLFVNLDGDSQAELLAGKRYRAHNGNDPGGRDPLCIYYYKYARQTGAWTRHPVHEGGAVGLGINTACADMDSDGDLDIVAPGKSGLYLIENLLH
ncbi:MAG: HEAT repeat domain-containing protein [Sedimentisphaerales bacterium]|nr:HEAT repeat domain-containing protein [Sedimentisphaerales bacterium]